MKKIAILVLFILLGNLQPANAVDVLPEPFFKYLGSKYLANPGVILIDGSTNEIVSKRSLADLISLREYNDAAAGQTEFAESVVFLISRRPIQLTPRDEKNLLRVADGRPALFNCID